MLAPRSRSSRLTWRYGPPLILGELLAILAFLIIINGLQLPHTIVPLVVWSIISLWLQGRGRRDIGVFVSPVWQLMGIVGVALGISLALTFHLVAPSVARVAGLAVPVDPDLLILTGPFGVPGALVMIWLLLALGEEFVFRGYLVTRLGDLFGRRGAGTVICVLASALVFAIAQGSSDAAAMAGTFALGIACGVLYFVAGRNLLLPVLFRGAFQTTLLFLAWAAL